MRKIVTRLSPREWCQLAGGDKPIYRAFRDKYEWDPNLRVILTGEVSKLQGGTKRAQIREELIKDRTLVSQINQTAKSDTRKYGSAEHDADITMAVFDGYAVLEA